MDEKVRELEEWAASEGLRLPFPAAVIARIEARGLYVDLLTGLVYGDPERVSLPVIGEAELIASDYDA